MATNGNTRKDNGIGTNPYIVANHYRLGADTLLIDALSGIAEVMIQCRNSDALCKVDMIANADRSDNRTVDADAGMVAYDDIAHRIIDTAERFDDTSLAQPETAIGRCVHAGTPIYL